jgi:aldose 1-epimerase
MYQIKELAFGAYQQYIFENARSGNGFAIVPEIGGTVLDIWFNGQSILDGYTTPEELTEAKWGKSAILFPFPNRLRDGRYFWQGETRQFPINNASTQNSIHGFARSRPFELVASNTEEDAASCTIRQDYDGNLDYYPFPCTLEMTFTIKDNGQFETSVRVENKHNTAIPVGFGWHPYFRLTPEVADTALEMPHCQIVAIDDRMIPTGDTPVFGRFEKMEALGDTFLDNCFLANNDYALRIEGAGRQLTMRAQSAIFPYFQIFTPPHRTSIALEPMSCNVDAFNNGDGLVSLEPGAVWSGDFLMEVGVSSPIS